MPRGKRTNVALRCQKCENPQDHYVMRLNRKEGAIKAFLRRKFCPDCRAHTEFKAKEIKGGY
jgi:ribosomal protein L33